MEEIEGVKKEFLGEIVQITLVYSAAKVGEGEEGYIRKQEEVKNSHHLHGLFLFKELISFLMNGQY